MNIADLQLPPHHIEAEKWVICCILLSNDNMYILDGAALTHADFYQKEHQTIVEAIEELWHKRRTIDVVTLSDQLSKMWQLDLVGWQEYLLELSVYLLTASVCYEYCTIVKEKSILRWILKTSQNIIWDVYKQEDTQNIIDSIEKRIFELTQYQVGDSLMHISKLLDMRVKDYMDIIDDPGKIEEHKVFSHYPSLDHVTWWFKPGELIILAARPAMGKTAFSLNIMLNAAKYGKKSVAIFSLEMTSQQLVDRVISSVSEVPLSKITKGTLDMDDFAKLGNATSLLSETKMFIDDYGGLTLPMLKSKLRRLVVEHGQLDLVIIDYLQLINPGNMRYAGNRVQEISEISRALKELAKELKVPIMALSQLSRAVESRPDKKPQLADLRDSGSIEQDADMVMFLYRDEYYDPDTDRPGTADVLIRKNRSWEAKDVELRWSGATQQFFPDPNWKKPEFH